MNETSENSENSIETRVGYATTSFLEKETRDYIIANTINGEYKGDPKYLDIMESLKKYNQTKDIDTSMFKGRVQGSGIVKKKGMFWK